MLIRKKRISATVSINFHFNYAMPYDIFSNIPINFTLSIYSHIFTISDSLLHDAVAAGCSSMYTPIVSGTTLNIHGASRRSETRIHHFTRVFSVLWNNILPIVERRRLVSERPSFVMRLFKWPACRETQASRITNITFCVIIHNCSTSNVRWRINKLLHRVIFASFYLKNNL